MLPDFPTLKREIAARLVRLAQQVAKDEPLLGKLPSLRQHEGNRSDLKRPDGSAATTTYENPLSAEAEIHVDDARREGPAASVKAMREVGEKLAEGMAKRMFETIERSVEAVGNVVNAKGGPFTADLFIEMLEKLELSFDEKGEWQPMTLVMHPELMEKYRPQLEALGNDPAITARIEAIVNRKRQEWYAREASRTLVD